MSHKMGVVEGVFKDCMDNIDAGVPNTTPFEGGPGKINCRVGVLALRRTVWETH